MPASLSRRRGRKARPDVLQKPRGVIHPRVQNVGPEHFGIVAVDCAKARSKWMLVDFYGKVLVPPTIVEHNRAGFDAAVAMLGKAVEQFDIRDLIVAVERTGRYHHPPARAFAAARHEVRTVHPFTTRQFRQPADPGNKTDDTDLAAISRAAINGFALVEPTLDDARIGYQERTLTRVLEWAQSAGTPDIGAAHIRRLAENLEADRQRKELEITAFEREIAGLLCATPYVLLMSIPGVNVVSAAEYAAEMGPMGNYANARCITGRAGLYPSRYQSDEVDRGGPMIKCANRRLRFAIMQIADNLIICNHYFATLVAPWRTRKDDPRLIRVRVAMRFTRISFQMVAGGSVFKHPAARQRDYVLKKLIAFHHQHQTPALQVQADLRQAAKQLPAGEHAAEAKPLQEELSKINEGRRRGPQPLGEILPAVLAMLGVAEVQSSPSGSGDPA